MALTIDDIPRSASYPVGGTPEDEFVVPFVFFEDGDLAVSVDGEDLTLTTDYTVTGAGTDTPNARKVTLVTPISDATITIVSDIPYERTTNLAESGNLDIQALNNQLARAYALIQQIRRNQTRGIRQPDSDEDDIAELPPVADRAGKPAIFNDDGDLIGLAGGLDTDLVPVSSFVEPILLVSDEASFRTAIGALSEAEIEALIEAAIDDALGDLAVGFDSGTAMLFCQTTAPTGWTKSLTTDNAALRVVTGTAGTGGSMDFTSAFASRSITGIIAINAVTLAQANLPAVALTVPRVTGTGGSAVGVVQSGDSVDGTVSTSNLGSGSSFTPTGTFTGTALNMAVKYKDAIVATKDA